LMVMEMKFSSGKHLNTSSSVHLGGFFSWRVLYRALAICSSLDTHTPRLRKVSRNRRKRVFETSDLKSFSVQSLKSSWYCSHNSLSMRLSCSHSLIFVSTHFSQSWISSIPPFNSGCGTILQGYSGLRGSGGALAAEQICKGSAACGGRRCSDCGADLQGFKSLRWSRVLALAAEQFCKGSGLRGSYAGWFCPDCGAARIWSAEIQKKRSPNQIVLGLLTAKIAGLIEIGVRENRPSIKLAF
jgi:ribosomal protein L34E